MTNSPNWSGASAPCRLLPEARGRGGSLRRHPGESRDPEPGTRTNPWILDPGFRRDDDGFTADVDGIEWHPSRWLIAALALLGALAAVSVLASALPTVAAWPAAAISAGSGLWLARRESLKPCLRVRLYESGRAEIDGAPVEDFQVDWRGALAFVAWRDVAGRRHRRVWWPDRLPPDARRELRLATPVESAARASPSMAP